MVEIKKIIRVYIMYFLRANQRLATNTPYYFRLKMLVLNFINAARLAQKENTEGGFFNLKKI